MGQIIGDIEFWFLTDEEKKQATIYGVRSVKGDEIKSINFPDKVQKNGINYTVTCIEGREETKYYDDNTYETVTDKRRKDYGEKVIVKSVKRSKKEHYNVLGSSYSSKLKSVKLPKTLKRIGDYAFMSCNGLKSIDIPSGVESIGYDAFYNTRIKKVTLPSSVKEIGSFAFITSDDISTTLKIQNKEGVVKFGTSVVGSDDKVEYVGEGEGLLSKLFGR